jgi:hypothetical protein
MCPRNSTSATNTAPGNLFIILNTLVNRCDNHYVVPAETPEDKGKLVIEFEQERGFEHKMFRDDREKDRNLSMM